jgi:hypothetical protein
MDGVVTFIVFFLLVIGFGTTPKMSCQITEPATVENVEKAFREYLPYFSKMFMIEILAGFVIIALTNYFIFKSIYKKPFVATFIALTVYIITIGLIYNYLYQDFIDLNISNWEC